MRALGLAMFVAAGGCYSSASTTGDAVVDGVAEADGAADTAPDTAADTADAGPEVTTAPYTLHEWGVVSIGDLGANAHGPSPAGEEPMVDKPVIYLYSDGVINHLDITVDFAFGGASEVWPVVPTGARVEWKDLWVEPGECYPTPFPSQPFGDEAPCEVCGLSTCVVEEADCITMMLGEGESSVSSRLLFYAGPIPGYTPPLDARWSVDDPAAPRSVHVWAKNVSARTVKGIWVVYRATLRDYCLGDYPAAPCTPTVAAVGQAFVESVGAGGELDRTLEVGTYTAPVDASGAPTGDLPLPEKWQNQWKTLSERLVGAGLTEKETDAFVESWNRAFFGVMGNDAYYVEPLYGEGVFLVYFMDRADYDALFALTASPPPEKSVRVGMVHQKAVAATR